MSFVVAEEQVGAVDNDQGAEVRLLQLEKSVMQNIEAGETVVAEVIDDNPEANVSDMQSIIAELEILNEEVSALLETDLNATEAAEEFVLVKQEAISLSRDFKAAARDMIPEKEQEKVRERARNASNEELDQLKEQVKERINEHNALQVQRVLERMGKENSTLVENVRNGQMNTGEAISSVAKQYKGLGQEKREEALAQAREDKVKAQVHKDSVEEKTKNIAERIQERRENRKEQVQQRLEQVRERVNQKVENMIPENKGPDARENETSEDNRSEVPEDNMTGGMGR